MRFVLFSLYLAAAKAQMQTIIINDFPRSLYKHSFRFLSPSSLVWQQLTVSVVLCFLIVLPHSRELRFPLVEEELSEGTHGHCEEWPAILKNGQLLWVRNQDWLNCIKRFLKHSNVVPRWLWDDVGHPHVSTAAQVSVSLSICFRKNM